MYIKCWLLFVVLCFLFASPVFANIYGVTPTHLSLSAKRIIGVVSITNNGDETGLLQLSLMDWQQFHDRDIFKPSQDILMTPPLFKLPPHKTQVIRFALRHPTIYGVQKTYRLHIKEVQQPHKKKLGQTLYFLVDISLPLFIQPKYKIEDFNWFVSRPDAKHVKLRLYNDGNVTLFVKQWQLVSDKKRNCTKPHATFVYILPEQSHEWLIADNSNINYMDITANINGKTQTSRLHRL